MANLSFVLGLPLLLAALAAPAGADSPQLAPVAVAEARPVEYRPRLTLSGDVAARSLVDVSFRLNGQVVERLADVGQHVEKGQLLARIDDAEQQANIRVAQASLDAARAQLVQAQANFNRQQALLAQGFATRSQFDQAQQGLRTAQSALDSAGSQASNAKDELSYTRLAAPVSGVVTARNVETGQVVQAAQTVFVVAEDGPRDAIFDVQETLVSHAKTGMAVTVALLSDPSVQAEGRIREIAPVVDAQTGTVRVKVGVAETPPAMALGATITGTVHMAARQVTVLPWSALTSAGGKPAVWRVDKQDHTVALAPVGVLAYEKERVVVDSGLGEGDLVVTRGAQLLRPGAAVDIVDGPEGAARQ